VSDEKEGRGGGSAPFWGREEVEKGGGGVLGKRGVNESSDGP